MFASLDIRSAISRALLRRGYGRRRFAGATLALLGFVSQYPIPVIHVCPVMNPHGIAVLNEDDGDSHDHSDHSRDRHAHGHPHSSDASHSSHSHSSGDSEHSDIQAAVAAMPPCHRPREKSAHSHQSHAGHGAQTEAGDEAGHSHDSCPVCQGHAQLLQDLPAPALPSLATLFQLQLRVPDFVETLRVCFLSILPPARAPPLSA